MVVEPGKKKESLQQSWGVLELVIREIKGDGDQKSDIRTTWDNFGTEEEECFKENIASYLCVYLLLLHNTYFGDCKVIRLTLPFHRQ
jgi:hypothetical protein